jgi:riboflavin kinase/FMN adenylyltransferase
VAGDARGKRLGFPTANLAAHASDGNEMLLKEGVYATWVDVAGRAGQRLRSVTNVGNNPTFAGDRPVHVEIHVLDFSGDLYGQALSVFFVRRLRGERHFKDVDALRTQIGIDIAEARKALVP